MGIGIGQVTEPHRNPVNVYVGGEAFERARHAINQLKSKRGKAVVLTSFVMGKETFDLIANAVYHLHDTLLEGISTKQWRRSTFIGDNQTEPHGEEIAVERIDRLQEFAARFLVAN
jgi:hypothetical protein